MNWVMRVKSTPWWAINRIYWMKYSASGNKAPPADWLTCVACSIVAVMHMYQSLPAGESCPCNFSSWDASSPQTPQTPQTHVLLILKLSLKASGNQLEETLSTSSHYLWACVLTPPEFSMFLLDLLTSSSSVLELVCPVVYSHICLACSSQGWPTLNPSWMKSVKKAVVSLSKRFQDQFRGSPRQAAATAM